jgi:MFS family permease
VFTSIARVCTGSLLARLIDSTTAESRSLGLAVVGAAFGLAFLVGPVLGGTISRYSLLLPVKLACVLAVINFFGVYLLLPESLPVEKRRQRGGFFSYVPVANIIEQLRGPLGGLLLLRLLFGTLLALLETSVGTVGRVLMPEATAQYLSYALASMALAYMLVQMGVMPVLGRRFSGAHFNQHVVKVAFVLLGVALSLWGTATTLSQLYLALFLFGAASAALSTALNTLISQRARQQEVGSSMGVAAALGSLTRVIGPLIGGYLLQHLGGSAPGFFGAALSLVALLATALVLK